MPLSDALIDDYRATGWVAPIDVFDASEAADVLAQLEHAEAQFPDHLHAENRNNAHLQFGFLADAATHPVIVDAARSLVGDDIVLGSTVLFIKEPHSRGFVSWHQDAMYMGLAPDNFVTAWLALTPSNEHTGCVSVIDGSHRTGAAKHDDLFEADNILTRGQTIRDIDPAHTSNLVLQPGQMSLHHPWLIHGSLPNQSSQRRVGLAMQGYMGSNVAPTHGEHHVMHIAGAAVGHRYVEAARPSGDISTDIATREAANAALSDVLYAGAELRRKL